MLYHTVKLTMYAVLLSPAAVAQTSARYSIDLILRMLGITAQLAFPADAAMHGAGNLFIADSGNGLIHILTPAEFGPPRTAVLNITSFGPGGSARRLRRDRRRHRSGSRGPTTIYESGAGQFPDTRRSRAGLRPAAVDAGRRGHRAIPARGRHRFNGILGRNAPQTRQG